MRLKSTDYLCLVFCSGSLTRNLVLKDGTNLATCNDEGKATLTADAKLADLCLLNYSGKRAVFNEVSKEMMWLL